jgi:hypothetical protein
VSIRGHNVKVEVMFDDTLGTNQLWDFVILYQKAPEGRIWWWKHYPVVVLNEAPPTVGVYADIITDIEDVRILFIATRQTNDEDDTKNLRGQWVLDGETETGPSQGAPLHHASGDWHYWYLNSADGAGEFPFPDSGPVVRQWGGMLNPLFFSDLEVQEATIRVRQESALGTNQQLEGRVVYERYEEFEGVGSSSRELKAQFEVRQGTRDLKAGFSIGNGQQL